MLIGVTMKMNSLSLPVIFTAEPRAAIITFLVATLWQFLHNEWLIHLHYQHSCINNQRTIQSSTTTPAIKTNIATTETISPGDEQTVAVTTSIISEASFQHQQSKQQDQKVLLKNVQLHIKNDNWNNTNRSIQYFKCIQPSIIILLIVTIISLFWGSVTTLITFTSYSTNETTGVIGCEDTYSLYTLGNQLVSNDYILGSIGKAATWILCITYIQLVIIFPIFVLSVQTIGLAFNIHTTYFIHAADVLWSFASIEVLILAILLVQVR
jgi:hypothetical protein